MTDGVDLRSLLERVQKAQGPDRGLDEILWSMADERPICHITQGDDALPYKARPDYDLRGSFDFLPQYTSSLDDAVSLVSKLLPDWGGKLMWNGGDIAKGGYVEMDLPNPRWKDPDCPPEEMNRYAGLVSSYDNEDSKPHDPKPFALALLTCLLAALIAKAEAEEGVGEF